MTGHLEQAGEASDFARLSVPPSLPKGVFPWHVPGAPGLLGTDPLMDGVLCIPRGEERVQQEPEVALVCRLDWADERVRAVRPVGFAAYNDASIRKEAPKISFKKNWGPASKGLGDVVPIDTLAVGGPLDRYRLVSFVERAGTVHAYGEDSAILDYRTFHQPLLDWLVDRFNHQADEGPLEDVPGWLAFAGRPTLAVIGIGATRYTPFGLQERLQEGDVSTVVVYDGTVLDSLAVASRVRTKEAFAVGTSVLRQLVTVA